MGSTNENYVDQTILNTPKPTATSTAVKKTLHKRILNEEDSLMLSNSLSRISESSISESIASNHLQEQRSLAENSLRRANNIVGGLPSKYLKPNNTNSVKSMDISENSTVNESDLMKPADSSTPRSSIGRTSLSQSVAHLSYKIKNTDISLDNVLEEFQKAMKMENSENEDNLMFRPAEEAASMFFADEMSWRRKNEIPVNPEGFSEVNVTAKTSIGEFFRQRSDTLSIFGATSPTKSYHPLPLIELSTGNSTGSEVEDVKKNKSLSISTIQRCLQSEDTPRKTANLLIKQSHKHNRSSSSLERELSPSLSKNSSYTSDPSDNELLNCIFDKENIDTLNTSNKNRHSMPPSIGSPTSRSSSRALTSLPDGKLPIESTTHELIWGSVKIDKCMTQDFSIRNKSSKRLGIQLTVKGHDFKIKKDSRSETDLLSATKIMLHPYESKVIMVSFTPTRVGACVDKLMFSPVDSKLQQTKQQAVRLFGYGGHEKIEFSNLTKDITGKFWLSLGKVDNHGELLQSFSVVNNGVLPSFVHINFNSKTDSQVVIEPNFFVLIPNEQKQVTVRNIFTAHFYKMFQKPSNNSSVFDLGNLNIITGAEVNRGRLRSLCRKLTEAGSPIDSLSNILKEKINGEVMPNDLTKFKESPNCLKKFQELFNKYEVVLTVERDPDQTLLVQLPDESGMYNTLCEDTTISVLENTVSCTSCRLEPSIIILTPPNKVKDILFLASDTNQELQYQVHCDPEGIELTPKCGVLYPRQEIKIYLKYSHCLESVTCYKITATVGNEVCQTLVKIKV